MCRSAVIAGDAPTMRCRLYGLAAFDAELPDLAPQPRRLERALDRRRDVVQIERLVGEVIRAELHRLDGGLDAGVGREQDDQDVLIELLHLAKHRHAVGVGQPVVEEHEIDAFGELLERGFPGVGFEDVVAFGLEAFAERPADEGFVVDNQDRGFGQVTLLQAQCRSGIAVSAGFRRIERIVMGNISHACGIFPRSGCGVGGRRRSGDGWHYVCLPGCSLFRKAGVP